jgi:hypothetical protein
MRLAVCIAAAAAALLPGCGSGHASEPIKRAGNRESYVLTPAQRKRVAREQAARESRAEPAAGRAAVLRRVEASILADARALVRGRELKGPIRRVTCDPVPGKPRVFSCTAVTNDIAAAGKPGDTPVTGIIGHPFTAVVDFASGRYAWCKRILSPGEGGIIDPRAMVPLPRKCNP